MSKCARCQQEDNCGTFTIHGVAICEECLHAIVGEWFIKYQEFGELAGKESAQ
jgi:hypothetical protein